MPSTHSRGTVLALCGAGAALGAAGCLGTSSTDPSADSETQSPSSTSSNSTEPDGTTTDRTTVPPSVVSGGEAKKRALAAEERYLKDRLSDASCLQNWGTTPTTSSERATVIDRTAKGVHVEVQHPYWYSTDRSEAGLASTAEYVVAADEVRRVEGSTVSPC